MIDESKLKECAQGFGVKLDEKTLESFDIYAERLIEKNKVMNLTAIIEPDEIVVKHFIDSLSVLSYVELPQSARVMDVGTGAGFPGVAMLIARPDLNITLLDGTKKKLDFVAETLELIGLSAKTCHIRAEEAGQSAVHRERYDLVTARAVASLRELTEYCLPLVKLGGTFIAMKSASADEETEQAASAIKLLGGGETSIERFTLPDGSERSLIIIRKISQTPTKYPRPSAKIAKQPLR